MATVTERPTTRNLGEAHRRVRDPLQQLRGYIRRYVVTEALTTLFICLAGCFWLGMLFDYGAFKLLGIDWVQDVPRWFRALILGGGLLGICFLVELRKVMKIHSTLAAEHVAGADGLLGKILRERSLLIAVAVPLGLVYFAAWIGIALWRDANGLGSLAVGLLVFALLAGFAALIVVKRLLYEFRDAALALVLEKRYPELLGDRLITAVELSNPKEAARYGYSAVMVEETIHEAAKRVGQLPVREVFDWKRLYLQGGGAIGLTVGVYVLTLAGLFGVAAATGRNSGNTVQSLNQTAGIWFERNVLLDNERWPKRALIVPVNFPASGEVKIGKGTSYLDLRALAIEYAIADRDVADRWRAVTLSDLRAKDLGIDKTGVPTNDELPPDWTPRDEVTGLTLDEVKLRLAKIDEGGKVHPRDKKVVQQLRDLLEQVDRQATDQSMSRTLRKLIVPEQVVVRYWGKSKRGEVTLEKQANNVYKGRIDELTESLELDFRAEDYVSDTRKITVVEPPRVVRLEQEESSPAYLYYLAEKNTRALPAAYASTLGLLAAPSGPGALNAAANLPPERPYDDDQLLLGRKKQARKAIVRTVAGESQPEIRLLATSDLILRIVTDKELDPEKLKLDAKGSPWLGGVKPKFIDAHTFEVTFRNIRHKLDFRFEFIDTDGVPGSQDLLIVPVDDESPTIQQFKPEVIRMVGDRYMITPEAKIPFSFVVRDDNGLSRLEFVYSLIEAPSGDEEARRFARVAGGIGLILSGPEVPLSSMIYNQALPIALRRNEAPTEGRTSVPHFQAIIDKLRGEMNEKAIASDLKQRVKILSLKERGVPLGNESFKIGEYVFKDVTELDPYLKDHSASVDGSSVPTKGFDVANLRRVEGGFEMPLKARELEIQKRYYLQVYLEAYDTNVERAGRGRRPSKQYPFIIVSGTELLYEIGKEEERLYDELRKTYEELKKGREQMSSLKFDLPADREAKFDADSFVSRTEAIEKVVREGLRITTKVAVDYDRILREMRTNRLQNTAPKRVSSVATQIVKPLADLQKREFNYSQKELMRLRQALDNSTLTLEARLKKSRDAAGRADKEVDMLVKLLGDILAQMRGVIDLNRLKVLITEIERKEAESLARLEKLSKILEDGLFPPDDPKKP